MVSGISQITFILIPPIFLGPVLFPSCLQNNFPSPMSADKINNEYATDFSGKTFYCVISTI